MRAYHRKSAPKVKRGVVQKKNNWDVTPDYYNASQEMPVVDRKRPGPGYRHVLKQRDIYKFISILPDWDKLSRGLNGIVLAPGEWNSYGYHVPGVIHICAWDEGLWVEHTQKDFEANRAMCERLGVPAEPCGSRVLCKWNLSTARAFQLLDVFLHELGHHHDRMTTKSRVDAARGEPYAETYARRYADHIWDRYLHAFALY